MDLRTLRTVLLVPHVTNTHELCVFTGAAAAAASARRGSRPWEIPNIFAHVCVALIDKLGAAIKTTHNTRPARGFSGYSVCEAGRETRTQLNTHTLAASALSSLKCVMSQ